MDNSAKAKVKSQDEVTPEQIERWKKEHGKVFEIKVDDAVAWVRSPTRMEMDRALVESNGGKRGMKFNELLLKDVFLGGDKRIYEEDEYFFGVGEQMDKVVGAKTADIKKL